MKRTREPCGCTSTDTHWIDICETHRAQWQALHEQAHREKREQAAREKVSEAIEDLL